jgi:4-aminobutyrate aminotransferase-like enzyme
MRPVERIEVWATTSPPALFHDRQRSLGATFYEAALRRGIVDIYDRGMHVVRWQPALTMPIGMFERACDILEDAIASTDHAGA